MNSDNMCVICHTSERVWPSHEFCVKCQQEVSRALFTDNYIKQIYSIQPASAIDQDNTDMIIKATSSMTLNTGN